MGRKSIIGSSVPLEVYERLTRIAEDEDRSVSAVVRRILVDWFATELEGR